MSDYEQAGSQIESAPLYRGHKLVRALKILSVTSMGTDTTTDENPIVRIDFVDPKYPAATFNLRGKPTPEDGWYLVRYEDGGYISFSPPSQFENGYTEEIPQKPSEPTRNYGWVLGMLSAGALMARSGWNGKGMFIFLVPGSRFKVSRHPLLGIFPEGTEIEYRTHIDIRNADGTICPWTPSQSDQMGVDWYQVESPVYTGSAKLPI